MSSVLILEDDAAVMHALMTFFFRNFPDVNVCCAGSIAEAYRLLQEQNISLFILDIMLPDGSGLDFLCEVRVTQPQAGAVILTSNPLPLYREEAQNLAALRFMEKPFDSAVLKQTVEAYLSQPSASSSGQHFAAMLQNLTITDVVQIKCMGRSTSQLHFLSGLAEADIYIQDGEVVHAVFGELKGVEAVNAIIALRRGTITEKEWTGAPEVTVRMPWQSLLMDALRAYDERRAQGRR